MAGWKIRSELHGGDETLTKPPFSSGIVHAMLPDGKNTELQHPKVDEKSSRLRNWAKKRGTHHADKVSPHTSAQTPTFGTCSGSITQHTCACVRFLGIRGKPSLNHMFTSWIWSCLQVCIHPNFFLFFRAFVECITSCFWISHDSIPISMGPVRNVKAPYEELLYPSSDIAKTPNNKKHIEWICRIFMIFKLYLKPFLFWAHFSKLPPLSLLKHAPIRIGLPLSGGHSTSEQHRIHYKWWF